MSDGGRMPWRRPREGALISGVALLGARATGLGVRTVRVLFVLVALLGAALALGFAVFDHALLGHLAPDGLRLGLSLTGLALFLLYPLLAFLLPSEERPRRWDFGSALGGVLLLVGVGQALGLLLAPYWAAAKGEYLQGRPWWFVSWVGSAAAGGFGIKEAVLALFFLSATIFVVLERKAVTGFFRAMHVGVTLVLLVTLSVATGVLVPQIDGFEDPAQRVDLAREEHDFLLFRDRGYQKLPEALADGNEQYEAFRWAEGYFLYHLIHLYGIGMPEGALTPTMEKGLEKFGEKYGTEERDNRQKQMTAAFSGQRKVEEIGAFVQRHENEFWRAFEVATRLDLNRTYKSSWFAALLWCLATSVVLSAYKNWRLERARFVHGVVSALGWLTFASALKLAGAIELPWAQFAPIGAGIAGALLVLGAGVPRNVLSIQKLGFFTVHNGLLVLLLGGLVSKLFTDRGILNLFLGEAPQSTYYRFYDLNKRARMPFSVRLDRFARKEWKALQVYFRDENFSSMPPSYTLWEGKTVELDFVPDGDGTRPRIRVHVDRLHDRAEVGDPTVSEGEPGTEPLPLAELIEGSSEQGRHFVAPLTGQNQMYPGQVVRDPGGRYRLGFAHGEDPRAHFPGTHAPLGGLEVTVVGEGDGSPRSYPVRLGETLEVQGGYKLSVVDATTDFRAEPDGRIQSPSASPLESQPRERAALWLDIVPPDGGQTERRVVLEDFDAVQTGQQQKYFHAKVVLHFGWDDWSAPGPPRYLLCWRGDGSSALLSEDGEILPAVPDQPLELPGGEAIVPLHFFERAQIRSNLEFPEPGSGAGWDREFYERSPRGAELTVTLDPGTTEERTVPVRLATDEDSRSHVWDSPDGRFVLRFFENTEGFPFEWRSVLSILVPDASGNLRAVDLGPEEQREIRVNDYLYYDGYRFFQSNADPREPKYSGIGVVFDPGIPLVLLGMYTIIAGTAIAFLVRPVVLRRRSEAAA